MKIVHLRGDDYRRMPWQNGAGWTTELYRHDDGLGGFGWRISIADIASDGEFSTFPQCTRWIALLEGNGMHLDFASAAPPATLQRPLQFVQFAGDWATTGRLIDGAVRDFNVIVRADAWRCEVQHRPLVGSMLFAASAADCWFIYLAAGSAQVGRLDDAIALQAGESLLLSADASSGSAVIEGAGDVVVVRLRAISDG